MLRVPLEEMAPLEKAAHLVGVDVHGLKCDTPYCGWSDMTIPVDAYRDHLVTKCPDCGARVLLDRDFAIVIGLIFSSAAVIWRSANKRPGDKS